MTTYTNDGADKWLDALCKIFAINVGGRDIKSFVVFERDELPAAINIETIPCAVSYITDCQPEYSTGGAFKLYWSGETDFHITKDVKPSNIPVIMRCYPKILAAAAANITLGGTVMDFTIPNVSGAMRFMTYLNTDNKPDHQGVVVRWNVMQHVSGTYEVKA